MTICVVMRLPLQLSYALSVAIAIYHPDDDDLTADDSQQRSSFGSSFRTFDGTDYSSIGKTAQPLNIPPGQYHCYPNLPPVVHVVVLIRRYIKSGSNHGQANHL